MKNIKRSTMIKKYQITKNFQLFLVAILLTIGEINSFRLPVLAQSSTVDVAILESHKLVSTTATYGDPNNPNIEINATSNDTSTKDFTINNNDLSFEDNLLDLDVFVIDSGLDILLESNF